MTAVVRLPDLIPHIDAILGAPYAQYRCWLLARHLFRVGLDFDIAEEPERAAREVSEIWFEHDTRDPLTLAQPWDLFVMLRYGSISEHVGVVIDHEQFVHARQRTGVVIEPMRRWRPKLLQLGRLRMLEGMA